MEFLAEKLENDAIMDGFGNFYYSIKEPRFGTAAKSEKAD